MDWQGQKLAEQLMQILLFIAAVVAFIVGYETSSFRTMMLIYAGGVVLTTLITVPNWPFFNRHHLIWLDPSEVEKHPKPQVVGVSSKKKFSKNDLANELLLRVLESVSRWKNLETSNWFLRDG